MHIGIVTHRVIHEDGQGRINYAISEEALERDHEVPLVAWAVAASAGAAQEQRVWA